MELNIELEIGEKRNERNKIEMEKNTRCAYAFVSQHYWTNDR